jgi:hypothetical protein
MSGLKHGALLAQGIEIAERVSIPAALVPDDAGVEIAAKRTAGYFSTDPDLSAEQLAAIKGRGLG